jgi:endonuclease YncB( thermonuclease family)
MSRQPIRILASLVVILTAAAASPRAADARTGPCVGGSPGPLCHFWTGRVVSVNDGDTIDVDLAGDGTRRAFTVRFSGLQAMEQTRYSDDPKRRRGQCHAVEATARVDQLLRASHKRVRLGAQDPRSRAGRRLRRWVAVRIGGRWRDIGETLISEGHAILMPGIVEDAWNRRYNTAEQQAALKRVGLWNPVHCGSGPHQEVPLRVLVSTDPTGVDAANLNGEWIKVQNLSATTALPLGGWWVRDSMLRRFTFPVGTIAGPGRTITVHTGPGQAAGESFYWGLGQPIFENANGDGRDLGDGGYLFDPQGDLRAAMVYPCLVQCSDPNQGAVAITAQARGAELVRVRNTSSHPVDLYGYELALRGSTYPFGPDSLLQPGEAMQIDINGDPGDDTALRRHWGMTGPALRDSGGSIALTTFTQITLACAAWGSGSC